MAGHVARSSQTPFDRFGGLLRDWRSHRRLSQLELSLKSGVSQRHISFLETGRSAPTRTSLMTLCDALEVPLRERNALLQAAGFSAAFPEQGLDDAELALFRRALQATLNHHEPFPALVLDGRWNLVLANQGALRFFSRFVDLGTVLRQTPGGADFQIVRLCLDPDGLRPFIDNWQDLAHSFLQRARRALAVNPLDDGLSELLDEILATPGVPESWRRPDWSTPPAPAMELIMRQGERRYRFFTMLAHFGAAQSVTLEELSVESFFPADEATRQLLLAEAPSA